MLFTPLPVTNCHTFSDPLPLERDVLYGQPLRHYNLYYGYYFNLTNIIITYWYHCYFVTWEKETH